MRSVVLLIMLALIAGAAGAQVAEPAALAERFTRMTAVTGFERAALDSVQRLLPGATRDRAGNVVLDRGTGPATLIVCPFDEVGYVVGNIREDGWLTLRRVGGRPPSPLFDQSHEGQRILVYGRQGALPGVIGVHSTHLQRGRSANEAAFGVDDAFVDIGAANASEAKRAGVEVLAPVAREKRATRYGNRLLSGPYAGRRAACAALVAAATAAPAGGRVVIAFVVEQELGQRGLRTLGNLAGPFAKTYIVDGGAAAPGGIEVRGDSGIQRAMPGLGTVMRGILPTRYSGTAVETVSLTDVATLEGSISAWIGGGR